MTTNVLTIDIGSSSLRTNLFDGEARRSARLETQLHYEVRTSEGGAEIDPDALVECLFSAIDETVKKAGKKAGTIEAVGFCSLVSNVLGVGADGKPTTPIYTWAD